MQVTDLLPAGLTLNPKALPSGYDPTTGVWNVGNLAIGASATLTLITTVDDGQGGQLLSNTATAQSNLIDVYPDDNSSTIAVSVRQAIIVNSTADLTDAAQYRAPILAQIQQIQEAAE